MFRSSIRSDIRSRRVGIRTLTLAALVLAGASLFYFLAVRQVQVTHYRTVNVVRRDIAQTVSATGTVEPEEVVDVGAQVAGRIVQFGVNAQGRPIDYGSEVDVGTVLARIDDSIYAAELAQQQAALIQTQANVVRAEAELRVALARQVQAERAWHRARQLLAKKLVAPGDADIAEANFQVAQATVASSRAAIAQAQGSQVQAEAAISRAQRSLSYCTIKSPVRGVIIDRRVNIGQTVVASLSAPSLFLIAKDLQRLQVWVAVNEADIGQIRPDMPVRFTVDAFPSRQFDGQVGKVRLNAAMNQNVVTYTVEVLTNNPDNLLVPYLTANVKFVIAEHARVLAVPTQAVRWHPLDKKQTAADTPGSSGASIEPSSSNSGQIWTPVDGKLKPIAAAIGISDGAYTEISGSGLEEGLPVVVGEALEAAAKDEYTSPFTPKFSGGNRNRKP